MKSTIKFFLIIIVQSTLISTLSSAIIEGTSGQITHAYYTNNQTMIWDINTTINYKPVKIHFTLNCEENYDFLRIYAIDAYGHEVLIDCSSGLSVSKMLTTILPTGKARIVFTSDDKGCYATNNAFYGCVFNYEVDNSTTTTGDLKVNGTISGNQAQGALRIQTTYGNMDLGPQNEYYAHVYTDRSQFVFNKKINLIDGVLSSFYNTNLKFYTGSSYNSSGTSRMIILNSNGNVGIGSSTFIPLTKLDVEGVIRSRGDIYGGQVITFQDDARFSVTKTQIPTLRDNTYSMPQYGIATPNTTGAADLWLSGNNGIRMFTSGNPNPRLNIDLNGNVGIGTLIPDEKLTVNGNIHAKGVLIDMTGPLADFVFDDDYPLMPLNKVKKFITINKHLPGIPSAKEVSQKSLDVGQMQNLLLQKIEELTLYILEQQKQINELQSEIKTLR